MEETLYQVHWKALRTGATGAGTGKYPLDEARQYAKELNAQDKEGEILHWVEIAQPE